MCVAAVCILTLMRGTCAECECGWFGRCPSSLCALLLVSCLRPVYCCLPAACLHGCTRKYDNTREVEDKDVAALSVALLHCTRYCGLHGALAQRLDTLTGCM